MYKGNLLPSFSVNLPNPETALVFKDSGAETSFICADLADRCKFKIVNHNITLRIRGFNTLKTIKADLVEVTFFNNNKMWIFTAICVPTIHVTPCIEGVGKLVDQKCMEMADIFLRKNVTKNIDILFGVYAFQLLPTQTQVFGNKYFCVQGDSFICPLLKLE